MDSCCKVAFIYNGEKKEFGISDNLNELYNSISAFFKIDLNYIDTFFIENISTKSVCPLSLNNVENGLVYNLLIRYKSQNNPESTNSDQKQGSNMQDNEYFGGYANLSIHRTMLSDKVRTLKYKQSIEECGNLIKDKIVLDVGAGTGILSIFAAKAGAAKVYSVDASSIVSEAEMVVSANNLNHKITLIEGKIEDISLPCSSVDLIVSEWMGSMLLYESMLHSVINARDRFLSPNGIMLPAHCDMFIVPLDLTEYISEHVGFWDNVFDVKMSVLQEKARSEFFSTPVFTRTIKERELLSEEKIFYSFETKTVTEKDLDDILSVFDFEVEKDGDLHGFGCWFDVRFLKTVLSTNPKEPETHWKQTTLVFDEISKVRKGDKINGVISLSRSSLWGRHYEVIIKYWFGGNSNRHFQKKFPLS